MKGIIVCGLCRRTLLFRHGDTGHGARANLYCPYCRAERAICIMRNRYIRKIVPIHANSIKRI